MRKLVSKLAATVLVSTVMLGGPVSPAHSSAPTDGTYLCTDGQPSSSTPNFTITSGVVSAGASCAGAVVIPAGVTSIEDSAFYNATSLTSITLPEGVTSIGNIAFKGATALTSITIPASVTSIGDQAFQGATALTSVTFAAGSTLTSIGNTVFAETALTSITIPEGVTSTGTWTFYGATALTSITLPASVTSIGDYAFYGVTSLSSITIPASVTSIGDNAFSRASALTSITIPASVTSIGDNAFSGATSLTSITVANGNPNYSSLDGVLFNYGETSLIQYPTGNSQTSYSIPASVTSIGARAFNGATALTSITIPASVTSIGDSAFNGATALTSITFDGTSTLTSIGAWAFYGATALTSITLPASVTSIGAGAFNGATSLTSVYFLGDAPTVGNNAFANVASGAKAYIETGATGFAAIGSDWNNLTVAFASAVAAPAPAPAPVYSGPVIDSALTVQAGSEVTFTGKRLDSVTSAFVGGVQLPVVIAESESLVLEVASSLPPGTYDLVIQSSFGSLTFHQGITVLASSTEESAIEPASDRKLSVGSFKGFIAIYTMGYDGQRLSAKVAGKWLVVESLDESFQGKNYSRTLRETGSGHNIKVHLYIDSEFLRTDELTTK